ncbi:hypothetical protein BX265_6138 [Streptomyces sp. TLI_235]|nr:hypothetical protein [Streptomyces sp. TLI_235]PBC71528.1 hypothetical protein BX265_6138 [Streptomyces sp. TLI_235]
MSYLGHRCGCGHLDIHHKADAAKSICEARGGASCGKGCRKSTKSVLVATYDSKARPVEEIVPPGERFPNGFGRTACACGNCQALYAELTGN